MASITKSVINIRFQEAMKKADELDEIASEIKHLAKDRYDATLGTLSGSWKGLSAEIFINKGGQLQDEMAQTAKELREIATTIRNSATRIRNAELKALEIATARIYH